MNTALSTSHMAEYNPNKKRIQRKHREMEEESKETALPNADKQPQKQQQQIEERSSEQKEPSLYANNTPKSKEEKRRRYRDGESVEDVDKRLYSPSSSNRSSRRRDSREEERRHHSTSRHDRSDSNHYHHHHSRHRSRHYDDYEEDEHDKGRRRSHRHYEDYHRSREEYARDQKRKREYSYESDPHSSDSSSTSVSSTSNSSVSSSDSPYYRESKRKREEQHQITKQNDKANDTQKPTKSKWDTPAVTYTGQGILNKNSPIMAQPLVPPNVPLAMNPLPNIYPNNAHVIIPAPMVAPYNNPALLFAQQQMMLNPPLMQAIPQKSMAKPPIKSIDSQESLCRIYVGNIHFELSEEDVKRTFAPFGTINNVIVSKDPLTQRHKGFCFIDFATPESAQSAIDAMNGFMLAGRPLKLGRPRQHGAALQAASVSTPPAITGQSTSTSLGTLGKEHALKAAQEAAAQINTQALSSASKIYVGSIHWDITEKDLIAVFSAFGPVLSCHLSPNVESGKHRGYGFIEYATAEQAEEAIKNMNGFELAGRKLKVNKAVPGAASATMQLRQQQLVTQKLQPFIQQPLVQQPFIQQNSVQQQQQSITAEEDLQIKGASQRQILMQKLLRSNESTGDAASRCIVLNNMVEPGDEQDPHLQEEVTSECSKYGLVEKVVIYAMANAIKIFVLFKQIEGILFTDTCTLYHYFKLSTFYYIDATKARQFLDKRWFGGRMIDAQFYNTEKFLDGSYQ